MDKAPQHHKSRKVRKYFEEHRDTLKPIYLPTASPEFMVLEECWNISKNDLLVLRGELLENLIKSNRPEKKIHEWEQSATEARKIIARTTLPNAEAIVFDPLMGTGAYLAAALQLGRRVIGVDNNEEMYNIAKANLILQLK